MTTVTMGPQKLITSPQEFTSGWLNIGREYDTRYVLMVALWLDVAINLSEGLQVRILAKHTADHANAYSLPIRAIAPDVMNLSGEFGKLTANNDQQLIVSWDLDGLIPAIQFQIKADVVGSRAASMDSCILTMARDG